MSVYLVHFYVFIFGLSCILTVIGSKKFVLFLRPELTVLIKPYYKKVLILLGLCLILMIGLTGQTFYTELQLTNKLPAYPKTVLSYIFRNEVNGEVILEWKYYSRDTKRQIARYYKGIADRDGWEFQPLQYYANDYPEEFIMRKESMGYRIKVSSLRRTRPRDYPTGITIKELRGD